MGNAMSVFLLSFLVVSLAVLGMALGTLLGRRPLTGGCGEPDSTDRSGVGCALCGGREQLDEDRS
jgi:hypothetical protein